MNPPPHPPGNPTPSSVGGGQTYAIVCGGGTAGHVLPAVAIARALVDRGHEPASIHYVGSERGIEGELVPEAGFALTLLPGRGIKRSMSFANLKAIGGLVRAFFQSIRLMRRLRPKVVVAVGGYASVACALAAVVWRVPVVVAEQNAVPGAANRLVARFAKAAAVSFPDTPLPRAVVTGNPVRPEVFAGDGAAARQQLGIENGRWLVLVMGGSLGALKLNRATLGALELWRERRDLAVRHVVGSRDWDVISTAAPATNVQYLPVAYERSMPGVLSAADVAVCRSGSSTCFELAAVGLPAILVPSPFVTGDHQTANARHVEAAGGAVVVPDAQFDGARLVAEVDALLDDADRRDAMAKAMRTLARPAAADDIAVLAEKYARD